MTDQRLSIRLVGIDIVLITVIGVVAASPLSDAYGDARWLVATAGGLILGIVVALASTQLKLGPWNTALATFVAYLAFGSALAVPKLATSGALPNPDALRALLEGLVTAWRDSVTLYAPLGSGGNVLVVPYVIGLLAGLLSGLFLWRSRWPGIAGLVLVATFAASAAFGDRLTELPLARGLAVAIAVLVWTRWRAARDVRTSWPRRIALSLATLSLASGVALGLTAVTSGGVRDVLRDHVTPPFDPLEYPSPLSRYRAYYDAKGLGDKTMFTSTGLSGGERVRIATMDTFDGIVWNVAGGVDAATQSGSFGRMPPATESPRDRRVSITIKNYSGPWVPTFGVARAVTVKRNGDGDRSLRSRVLFNKATGTMAQVGGVQAGTTYELQSVVRKPPRDPDKLKVDASVVPAPPADVPALAKRVQRWLAEVGGPSGGAMAAALEKQFQLGFYSDGKEGQVASSAGHGVKRLTDLVTPEDMIGNDEQYASAMGVAAQSHGLPARVVLGFVMPDDSGTVKGKDIHAWVEVKLAGAGWVAYVPTPDKTRTPKRRQNDPFPEPQPAVLQPPVVPKEPNDLDQVSPQGAGKKRNREASNATRDVLLVVVRYVGGAGIATSPFWLLLLAKSMRRRRRRNADDLVVRVRGGWKEIVDHARDHGTRLPASNTRYENGVTLAARFPTSDAVRLATAANGLVFSPRTPTPEDASAYWDDVDATLKRIATSTPVWRRPLVALSPASIPWAQLQDRGLAWLGLVATRVRDVRSVVALRRSLARLRLRVRQLRRRGVVRG